MDAIAALHPSARRWRELVQALREEITRRGAHPARTVVLLPYAQLMPIARRFWAELVPSGFAPRFETTMNWARQRPWEPAELDL
jgi:ATP-dependent helicase/nuclease subunit B